MDEQILCHDSYSYLDNYSHDHLVFDRPKFLHNLRLLRFRTIFSHQILYFSHLHSDPLHPSFCVYAVMVNTFCMQFAQSYFIRYENIYMLFTVFETETKYFSITDRPKR